MNLLVAILAGALLIQGCATPEKRFSRALYDGDVEAVRGALEQGADVNRDFVPGAGITPLYYAVRGPNSKEIVRLLLDRGADPNTVNSSGSPLLAAIAFQHWAAATLLIEHGASPNAMVTAAGQDRGMTPLIMALAVGKDDLATLMLEHGVQTEPVEEYAKTYTNGKFYLDRLKKLQAQRKEAQTEAQLRSSLAQIEAGEKAGDDAVATGKKEEALSRYQAAIAAAPIGTEPDARLRDKMIKLVRTMPALPYVPEAAKRHSARAQVLVEDAKDEQGYRAAATEFEEAIRAAPWLPSPYYNLAVVQERLGDFAGAIKSLKVYLDLAPNASDAKAVQTKIYKLEARQEVTQ